MSKNRLEAFSDGVFAIIITLLILTIKLPDTDYSHLLPALISLIPNILAYILSFVVIGMYWLGHHVSFQAVAHIDGTLIWFNIVFLLFVSLIPIPTYLIGHYPMQPVPLVIYGINLIAANLMGLVMILYLYYHPKLATGIVTRAFLRANLPTYAFVNISYAVSIACAFFCPQVSYLIYGIIIVAMIKLYARRGNHQSRQNIG